MSRCRYSSVRLPNIGNGHRDGYSLDGAFHPDDDRQVRHVCQGFFEGIQGETHLAVDCREDSIHCYTVAEQNRRPGIVDIQVAIAADRYLSVGDDVMMLVVAGDVRENVIAVLKETQDAIKTTVTRKTEDFEN